MHQCKTYINGLFDAESPNFEPNHEFLSSIEAEPITFLEKKAAILVICLLLPYYKYFNVAPYQELKVGSRWPLIPKMVLSPTQ